MADLRITELQKLLPADVVAQDQLAIADVSASETKKIGAKDLGSAIVRLLDSGEIPVDKIDLGTITIDGSQIIDGSVPGTALEENSITNRELAPNAVDTENILNGSVTAAKLGDIAERGLSHDPNTNNIGHENQLPAGGTFAGITYDEFGHVTDATGPIPATDLPVATETTIGAVSVPPEGGISVSAGGAITHTNSVTGGTFGGITYDDHGHITAVDNSGAIPSDDLPIAGTTVDQRGVVYVPTTNDNPIQVAADGAVTHTQIGVAGEYPKVTVNEFGHVTAGTSLDVDDIPDLPIDKIAGEIGDGTNGGPILGECAVTAPNICDYATCLMQEDNPGRGDFLGQFWYTPSTAQLRVYSRGSGPENIWLPVGFGALQANNLRWGGTYDADTDTIVSLTAIGISEGLTAGQVFPAPSDQMSGLYFICQVAGNNMLQPNINNINHTAGDWALCIDEAQGWVHIDANASSGGGGGGAQYLNDLLDVEIGGASSPFSTAPAVALSRDHLLRYDGGSGLWRNTDIIDGGSID